MNELYFERKTKVLVFFRILFLPNSNDTQMLSDIILRLVLKYRAKFQT